MYKTLIEIYGKHNNNKNNIKYMYDVYIQHQFNYNNIYY